MPQQHDERSEKAMITRNDMQELGRVLQARRAFLAWVYPKSGATELGTFRHFVLARSLGEACKEAHVRPDTHHGPMHRPIRDGGAGLLMNIAQAYFNYGLEATCLHILYCGARKGDTWYKAHMNELARAFREVHTKLDELGIARDREAFEQWAMGFFGEVLAVVQGNDNLK
jgi:hypothetical protein